MKELWDNILNFMHGEAFKIGSFSMLWWYVIVAAAALVVLLIVITIAVACTKKKKKKKLAKAAETEQAKESIHSKKNAAQLQPFNEIAPDWQPVAVATKMSKKEQKQAAKLEKEHAKEAAKQEKEQAKENAKLERKNAKEAVQQESKPAEVEAEQKQAETVEKPVETIVTEPAETIEKPAETTATEQAEPAETIETPVVAERLEKVEQKQNVAVAEQIKPVSRNVAYTAPKTEQVQAPTKPIEKKTTIVRTRVVTPAPVVEDTAEQETAATTPPRALPKKTNKTTKKTAAQIANDIENKTGTDPRRKSDKPAIVGQDKLPKKATKAQKAEAAKTELAEGELPLITTDPNVESFGKFIIIKNDDNSNRPYHFRLLANNGQILFESESYKSKPKSNSIIAFKKAAANEANFEIDADKAGNWRYKLYNAQHAVIGVGESYSTKQGCENSVQSVIKFAESARFLEDQTEA